jgi:hypothetical protein
MRKCDMPPVFRCVFLVFMVVLGAAAASVGVQQFQLTADDLSIASDCPTYGAAIKAGWLPDVLLPRFSDSAKAKVFGAKCEKIANELSAFTSLPAASALVRERALIAGVFLQSRPVSLATSKVPSVVALRNYVKIPPPQALCYVKVYPSVSAMPSQVAAFFPNEHIRGVTINGRYIALLESDFHGELEDTLAHELVHAYFGLVSGKDLPKWFQEGAAVYFSIGEARALYGKPDNKGGVIARQIAVSEDYKARLIFFKRMESRMGREKFLAYIRRSVITGNVNPRADMGYAPPAAPAPERRGSSAAWIAVAAVLVGAGFLAVREGLRHLRGDL